MAVRTSNSRSPLVVSGIVAAVLFSACRGGSGAVTGGTANNTDSSAVAVPAVTATPFKPELVICSTQEPEQLLASTRQVGQTIERALIRPAAVYGTGYTPQADLLRSLPSEGDGSLRRNQDGTLTVTLHYRDDLKWSDGEPFKTADAVLGFKAQDVGGSGAVLDGQEGDALSVVLTLAADAEYPYVPMLPPLPSHKLAGIDPSKMASSDYAHMMNPTLGPYYVAEWTAGQSIVLRANPYYVPAPTIPVVRFRFVADSTALPGDLVSGRCDVVLNDSLAFDQYAALGQAQASGSLRVNAQPGSVQDQVALNTYPGQTGRVPYFADVQVRQAVAYAFDRASLGAGLWRNTTPLMDSWLPAGHWAYSADGLVRYPYDPAKAKALLDQAGWVDQNGDGVREYAGEGGSYSCQRGDWKIEKGASLAPLLLLPSGDPIRDQIATKLKADLGSVGIAVQVQAVDPAALFAADGPITRRDFDLALLTTVTRPDPGGINEWVGADVFRHPLNKTLVHRWQLEDRWLTSDQLVERLALSNVPSPANDYQGQNFSGWCDEEADFAVVQANQSLDPTSRAGFYAEQQKLFTLDIPVLPLFMRPRLVANASTVCGLEPGPWEPPTWNLAQWYFDPQGKCGQ